MILFQILAVGTGTHIKSVYPGTRNQFDKIMITLRIFSQDDQVITTLVSMIPYFILLIMMRHIHFTSQNRDKLRFTFLLKFGIFLLAIIIKIFYTHHVSMIGNRHSPHSICDSLIDQFLNTGLTI